VRSSLRVETRVARWAIAAIFTLLAPTASAAADSTVAPATANTAPTEEALDAALQVLRDDPDLSGKKTERVLRLKRDQPPQATKNPEWLRWIVEFFAWLGEAGRFVVWALGALAVVLLVVFIARALREGATGTVRRLDLPSHVGELDIRPESLPDDVGAAARDLWQRGELRAALSLLYRGALSHLAHDHDVPIRSSSTEGECVALARVHLPPPPANVFGELVGVWQLAVYGGHMPAPSVVERLCREFAPAFTRRTPEPPAQPMAATP
jgi:hypothetical protein